MPLEYQWAALMLVLILALPVSFVLVRIAGRLFLDDPRRSNSAVVVRVDGVRLGSRSAFLVKV